MDYRLTDEKIAKTLESALTRPDLISVVDTALVFYDLSFLEERIVDLVSLFPDTTLHAIAIKANPLGRILEFMRTLDVGLEAASLPELYLAVKAGFPPSKIVFDSPAKTAAELEFAINRGVHINADSLMELARINALAKNIPSSSTFGIRINPQVGTGDIAATSTAGEYSKFGVPITDNRDQLIKSFIDYDWLTGVHLHIGSQGCPVDLLEKGAKTIVDFVNEANAALRQKGIGRRINIFDLGGGLPVSYYRGQKPVTMAEYRRRLQPILDRLEGDDIRLITEFGRYIHANTGWVASRVEYVKREPKVNTAMVHIGADMFIRACYQPEHWHHEVMVVDGNGDIKSGHDDRPYVIAGPLCFAGDVIARNLILPRVEEGDYIIIQDAGAYTLSMWSRYNSRQMPKVIGYRNDGESFEILRDREEPEDLWNFWH